MRILPAAFLALFLSSVPSFANAPSAVALAPAAQTQFEKVYGASEANYLSSDIDRELVHALAARGVSATPLRIEVTLLDAKPDHPTQRQLTDNVSLDYARSISIGGADIEARLLDPQGRLVRTIKYSWYEPDLRSAVHGGTWSGAELAIGNFARRVAAAIASQS